MPDKKITDLSAASSLAFTDLVPGVIDPDGSPVTNKVTMEQIRDLFDINEIYHREDLTPHASDDEFDGSTLAPGWVQVLGTGYTAPTTLIDRHSMNLNFSGATGGTPATTSCAYLKSLVGSVTNCTIETSLNLLASVSYEASLGLIMADGTNPATSNVAIMGIRSFTNEIRFSTWHGTLDALTNVTTVTFGRFSTLDKLKMRLDWSAANLFTPTWSLNGSQWSSFAFADISKTMTPTYFGLSYAWANGSPALASFDYFRKVV